MLGLGTRSIENWPEKSRESALRIIEQYGEPDEVTEDRLVWHKRGPWRQIIASKCLYQQHNFPAPHYALFELEPKDQVIEKKSRRAAAKRAEKAARSGAETLASLGERGKEAAEESALLAPLAAKATRQKSAHVKPIVAKASSDASLKGALAPTSLGNAPLRKSSIGKATLALRKARPAAPASSSAA